MVDESDWSDPLCNVPCCNIWSLLVDGVLITQLFACATRATDLPIDRRMEVLDTLAVSYDGPYREAGSALVAGNHKGTTLLLD